MIVNDFTNQYHHGHGTTPGAFLMRYIARHGATEPMTPENEDTLDSFVLRYMNRKDATERAEHQRSSAGLVSKDLDYSPLSGRAFGNLGDSYSEDELKDAADKVQDLWDQGHTVQKMVVSFRTEYLIQNGLLPSDFMMDQRGAAKGKLDQMKLRHALNQGMERYTKKAGFENPVWTGSVQVDTLHVHAHIVVVDNTEKINVKRMMPNGEERGKLHDNEKQALRLGINHELQDMSKIHQLHYQADLNRSNVLDNVDDFLSNQRIVDDQLAQVIASLPKNRSLWAMNSHAKVMRKPNELMHNYVDALCDHYGSQIGYDNAVDTIKTYADEKVRVDSGQTQDYINRGVNDLKDRIGNHIYYMMRDRVGEDDLTRSTPFIKQEAEDTDEIVEELKQKNQNHDDDIDMLLYSYRLGTYGDRMSNHSEKNKEYHDAMKDYQNQAAKNQVDPASIALYDHLKMEARYHQHVLDKYRYFSRDFDVTTKDEKEYYHQQRDDMESSFRDLAAEGIAMGVVCPDQQAQQLDMELSSLLVDRDAQDMLNESISNRKTISDDVINYLQGGSIDQLSVKEVDRYTSNKPQYETINEVFSNYPSGRDVASWVNDVRLLTNDVSDLTYDAFNHEMISADEIVQPFDNVKVHLPHNHAPYMQQVPRLRDDGRYLNDMYFNQVKGLDLHDLKFDFGVNQDIKVSQGVKNTYIAEVNGRQHAVDDVVDYLQRSHQSIDLVKPVQKELKYAHQVVDGLKKDGIVHLGIDDGHLLQLESQRNLATTDDIKTNQLVTEHVDVARKETRKMVYEINTDLQV